MDPPMLSERLQLALAALDNIRQELSNETYSRGREQLEAQVTRAETHIRAVLNSVVQQWEPSSRSV